MAAKTGVVSSVMLVLGLAMIGVAVYVSSLTRAFVESASRADGEVVRMIRVSDDGSDTWKPEFRFRTADGEEITLISSMSSNPPLYEKGERVTVLYQPDDPHSARIKGLLSLWGTELIIAGIGGVIVLIQLTVIGFRRRRRRQIKVFRQSGIPVETRLYAIDENTRHKRNGRHPWRITTRATDPDTGEVREFHSENIWFDPTDHIDRERITAYVDRANPERYYLDTSFLPASGK